MDLQKNTRGGIMMALLTFILFVLNTIMFLDLLANSKTYKKKIYEKLENDVVYELEKRLLAENKKRFNR